MYTVNQKCDLFVIKICGNYDILRFYEQVNTEKLYKGIVNNVFSVKTLSQFVHICTLYTYHSLNSTSRLENVETINSSYPSTQLTSCLETGRPSHVSHC